MREREAGERVFVRSHPDYVSLEKLRGSIETLGTADTNVGFLLMALEETPEYLVAK
jgi:hypothetical protein